MSKNYSFPKNFLWGAATSSHQVEGGNHNDWSEWELKNAERLAREAKNIYAPWQQEKFPEMFDPQNYISSKAADHYNRYEEDFDIAKELGHTAHRFSIEWSRVEPEEGKFDEEAIEHYRKVIRALRARGIEPFVTLWHWTLPVWFANKGGFSHDKNKKYFVRYAKTITKEIGDDVQFWITLNEPQVYASHSYMRGVWPPMRKSVLQYLRITKNLIHIHHSVYEIIKEIYPHAQIGIAKHNVYFEASGTNIVNRVLKFAADKVWNKYFLNRIKKTQDFIGLNNYHHNRIDWGYNKNLNEIVSDFNWELYPDSLYHALFELKKYDKPVYITEHGCADQDDVYREQFIKQSLRGMHRAIAEGVDLRGYLHWSFLDNFEWDKGFWLRFGLIAVDFKTQKRTIRKSARAYAEICKSGTLVL